MEQTHTLGAKNASQPFLTIQNICPYTEILAGLKCASDLLFQKHESWMSRTHCEPCAGRSQQKTKARPPAALTETWAVNKQLGSRTMNAFSRAEPRAGGLRAGERPVRPHTSAPRRALPFLRPILIIFLQENCSPGRLYTKYLKSSPRSSVLTPPL